jgi:hypothetical protein
MTIMMTARAAMPVTKMDRRPQRTMKNQEMTVPTNPTAERG